MTNNAKLDLNFGSQVKSVMSTLFVANIQIIIWIKAQEALNKGSEIFLYLDNFYNFPCSTSRNVSVIALAKIYNFLSYL